MNLIIALLLFLGVYFEYQGMKACVKADAMPGVIRSMFNILLLFGVALYVLTIKNCSEVLQFI